MAIADTLANDGTKATPSATSASPSDGLSGWISDVVISPATTGRRQPGRRVGRTWSPSSLSTGNVAGTGCSWLEEPDGGADAEMKST